MTPQQRNVDLPQTSEYTGAQNTVQNIQMGNNRILLQYRSI